MSADAPAYVYVYGTGDRPDGYRFAVGSMWDGGSDHGSRALFVDAADAHLFVYALQERTGCMVHILPSAEITA